LSLFLPLLFLPVIPAGSLVLIERHCHPEQSEGSAFVFASAPALLACHSRRESASNYRPPSPHSVPQIQPSAEGATPHEPSANGAKPSQPRPTAWVQGPHQKKRAESPVYRRMSSLSRCKYFASYSIKTT
jgi:hypothetical protein